MIRLYIVPLLCAAVFLSGGCSRVGQSFASYDEFTGRRVQATQVMDAFPRTIYNPFSPGITFRRHSDGTGSISYDIHMVLRTSSENFEADHAIWLADGETVRTNGHSRFDDISIYGSSATYTELAWFDISEEQLKILAQASDLKMKLYGPRYRSHAIVFNQKQRQAITTFCRNSDIDVKKPSTPVSQR